ncbi:hypothetical protein B0T20DRAFT_267907 [Sordaria brevicollis]|uniref:Zn(2)-C6 fungal-type domain-containing protein n=1 Tax=Sordaria brevicollis TaxID=83679 RepID=A0AAE0UA86_SORBR|nr:hypothetical protein B0T20DRAFT_267907 [Sordaria brevicollis]
MEISGNRTANGAPTPADGGIETPTTTPSMSASTQNSASTSAQDGHGINTPSPGNQHHHKQQLHGHPPQYHPNSSSAHLSSGQQLDNAPGSQLRSATTPNRQPDPKASAPSQTTAHNPPPFPAYPPHSPASSGGYSPESSVAAGTATAHDTPADAPTPGADGEGGRDPNGEPKKPRACESCRGLKVRCEPDPANPSGDCKRCAKAKRPCIVTEPSRKRQRKADNRVAELERKIDALTATLQHVRSGANPLPMGSPSVLSATTGTGPDTQAMLGRYTAATPYDFSGGYGRGTPSLPPSASRDWSIPPTREQQAASGRQQAPLRTWQGYGEMDHDNSNLYSSSPTMALAGRKRKQPDDREPVSQDPRETSFPMPRPPTRHADIVDRKIISMEQAAKFLERYNKHMVPHLPGVVFPADMTAEKLKKTKPILFHAVMAAAAGEEPLVQKTLTNDLMKIFAEEVMVTGNKSLELVQAIQIATIWYWPPERFEELKFYQLLHIAAVMAIDLGLGRKRQPRGGLRNGMPSTIRDKIMYKPPPPDPTSIESRRAWLTCYFLATNTSMALHRPNLIRWSSFMEESVKILETSPEAAPTDKYLVHLIWTHRLAEEVGTHFFDDHNSNASITSPRTQHLLSFFEHKLDQYRKALPDDMRQPSLMLSFYVLDLYMHEIVWQNDSPDDAKGQVDGQTTWLDGNLTPAHVKALGATREAIEHIFGIFLDMEIHSIRCLPAFSFVRIAYAVVILIRIHLSVISPKTELGKVMTKEDLDVENWIEKLLAKFKATMADDKNRPAAKFYFVLGMLRQWFQAQKQPPGTWPKGSRASRAAETGPSEDGVAESSSTASLLAGNQTTRNGNAGDNKDLASGPGAARSMQAYKEQQQQRRQQPNASSDYPTTGDTPLHLLSEVATHESSTATPSSSGLPPLLPQQHTSTTSHMPSNADIILSTPISAPPPPPPPPNGTAMDWNHLQQHQPPPYMSGVSPAMSVPDLQQQPDPRWLSQAVGQEIDGFEQAMDLTFGAVPLDGFDMWGMDLDMEMGGMGGVFPDGGLGAAGLGGPGGPSGGGGGRSAYDYGQGWYGQQQQQQQQHGQHHQQNQHQHQHHHHQQQDGNQGGAGGHHRQQQQQHPNMGYY